MAALSQSDLDHVSRFLRGLYRTRRVLPLIWYVLRELPGLVGSNQVTWNRVVPLLGEADVMAWPAQTQHAELQSALARNLNQHPLIVNFLETGKPNAAKISDFLSKRSFHNSALYDELYRHLKYEDQFALNLLPLGPQWTSLVVAREERTFTERDRRVLDLVRPHVAQAYRQACWMNRFTERFDAERTLPATSRIVLDASGAIASYPKRAQRWIEQFCRELPTAIDRLPESVEAWLSTARTIHSGADPGRVALPLVFQREGRTLRCRLVADDRYEGRTIVVLEERIDPQGILAQQSLSLTAREMEVLLEVESGKHNDEIAAELGIQPRTVKKHLEHIFDKLDVDNRTAAVARLRQVQSKRR